MLLAHLTRLLPPAKVAAIQRDMHIGGEDEAGGLAALEGRGSGDVYCGGDEYGDGSEDGADGGVLVLGGGGGEDKGGVLAAAGEARQLTA